MTHWSLTLQEERKLRVFELEGICKVVVGGITGKDFNEQGFHGVQNKNVCGENLNEKEY